MESTNKDKPVLIRLTKKQKETLELNAKDNQMNVSELIRYVLKKEGLI